MRPKFTTGMKTCLIALFVEIYRNLYWFILALAFALMLWLAPKANATPLEDFLIKNNLEFPREVKEQMIKQNLVAGAGILNEKEQIFTVFFLPKPETFDIQEFDPHKAIMQCRFYLIKKKIVIEYTTYCECSHSAKCWPNNRTEKIYIFLELWHL